MDKEPYVINYNDGRSMLLNLTESQWITLSECFVNRAHRMRLEGIGLLDLHDVRSVIKQEPVVEQDNPSYSTEMTQEEKDYIAQQEQFEQYLKEKRDSDYEDESDFDGSDI